MVSPTSILSVNPGNVSCSGEQSWFTGAQQVLWTAVKGDRTDQNLCTIYCSTVHRVPVIWRTRDGFAKTSYLFFAHSEVRVTS